MEINSKMLIASNGDRNLPCMKICILRKIQALSLGQQSRENISATHIKAMKDIAKPHDQMTPWSVLHIHPASYAAKSKIRDIQSQMHSWCELTAALESALSYYIKSVLWRLAKLTCVCGSQSSVMKPSEKAGLPARFKPNREHGAYCQSCFRFLIPSLWMEQ